MIDETFLKSLGFRDFIHLREEKRDSLKRLTAVRIVEGQWFTIQLVKKDDTWNIEKLMYEGDKRIFNKYFPIEPSLEEVINKLFTLKNK